MPLEMDFDDAVAAFREVAEKPLPLRVNEWRVFVAVLLEAFCPLASLRKPSVITRKVKPPSLRDDAEDLQDAMQYFQHVQIPPDRVRRIPTLYAHGMATRATRVDQENSILVRAIRRGRYLGWTAWMLAVDAIVILLASDRYQQSLIVFASFLFAETLTLFICMYDWHYRDY